MQATSYIAILNGEKKIAQRNLQLGITVKVIFIGCMLEAHYNLQSTSMITVTTDYKRFCGFAL